MELKESLKALGWGLSLEGLSQCVESCQQQGWEPTPRNVEKIAADRDLRAVGEPILSEDIIRNLQHQVEGPIVLQVQRVKNVVVPSSSQHLPSPSRRLLRLQLTDGHVHCSAVEMEGPIQNLSPLTPPGTKVRLRGKVEVKNGFLLLGRTSLEHLGGQVEHLLKKWSVQQIVPDNFERSKSGIDGPPPYIPFKDIAPTGKHSEGKQEHSVAGEGPHARKQPQQKQEHSVGREGPHPRDQKTQKPRFEDRNMRSKDEQRYPGRDKTVLAQTASRRHDGKAAGYKPRQPSQFRNEDGGERDIRFRTQPYHQQQTDRLSTSRRTEGEGWATRPSKAAASDSDGPGHSTRDSYRQPRQRDDSRPSRSRQRGSQEESVRKTEYQLSDWLDQKLKLNSRSSSDSQRESECQEEECVRDSQHGSEYWEEECVRDSLSMEVRARGREAAREGQYSEYSRKELPSGRREQRWREGGGLDGPGAGGKKSTFDRPKERPARFHQQRRDQPSDWLDQKPKLGDARTSGRQYGIEYHKEMGSEFKGEKLEVRDRHGAERYGGREFQKSKSEGQGRKRDEQTRPHSKERVEKVFERQFDRSGMQAQRSSSERQKDQERDDHDSKRHRDQLASHPGVREAWTASGGEGEIGRGSSQSRYGTSDGREPGREKYNWDWVNRGAPCGATKQ